MQPTTETMHERFDRENREMLDHFNRRNTEVLPAIAKTLNWQFKPETNPTPEGRVHHPPNVFTLTKNGTELAVSFDQYLNGGRVVIVGRWPKPADGSDCTPYNVTRHEITVAETKTPEQIAKDITRRLLPDFLADWRLVKANCDEHDTKTATFAKVQARLIQAGDLRPLNDHNQSGELYGKVGSVIDKVRIGYGGASCDVTLNLTADQAAKLLRHVREWPSK